MGDACILVVNAGSSSIKVAVFDGDLRERLDASATEIGGASALRVGQRSRSCDLADHDAALAALIDGLAEAGVALDGVTAAGHRVVHGGADLTRPMKITPQVSDAIEAAVPLAPLHNPHNLSAIRALARRAPDLVQVGCFDTAFHATNPQVATRYALPDTPATRGIRRYGFHGLSYAGLVTALPRLSGEPLPERVLACHLGNGASLCAIRAGRSVATTMGYSPLEGLTMGTRAGSIDGNAVLVLASRLGIDGAARLLNHESGLRGLSGGQSDMRALTADGGAAAEFAVRHFCYWAVRHAGSMVAAMGGLDAIAFSGGIGEHAAGVRAEIVAGLGWLGADLDADANGCGAARLHTPASRVGIWRVPAEEERVIARETLAVCGLWSGGAAGPAADASGGDI